MHDTRWPVILAKAGRGCIIGLSATCLLGLLGGTSSMWPDVDHLPSIVAVLFPAVYGDLSEVPPRFLHYVYFHVLLVTTIGLAASSCGWIMAIVLEMGKRHGNIQRTNTK